MMLYYQRYSTVTDWPSTFGRFACKEILFPSFYKRLKNHLWGQTLYSCQKKTWTNNFVYVI